MLMYTYSIIGDVLHISGGVIAADVKCEHECIAGVGNF